MYEHWHVHVQGANHIENTLAGLLQNVLVARRQRVSQIQMDELLPPGNDEDFENDHKYF